MPKATYALDLARHIRQHRVGFGFGKVTTEEEEKLGTLGLASLECLGMKEVGFGLTELEARTKFVKETEKQRRRVKVATLSHLKKTQKIEKGKKKKRKKKTRASLEQVAISSNLVKMRTP
jgi:hypothetical protein